MKGSKLFYLMVLILPWLTIPLLGNRTFKRYAPAAAFICAFTKVIDIYGEKKKWWKFYRGIPPFDSMNFFNLGPYFVTSLWILKMTYGKFTIYLFSNIILHICFIFLGGLKLVKHFKFFTLVRLTKIQYFFIDVIRAFLLYGFQILYDFYKKNKPV